MKDKSWDNIAAVIETAMEGFYTKHPKLMDEVMALNKRILDDISKYFPEEKKKKYKLVNDCDGNDQIELTSTNEEDAITEAFETLGWSLVVSELEPE